jgi:hypothetical protein
MEEHQTAFAQSLLAELNIVNAQEKAMSALLRSTISVEERADYRRAAERFAARWNELYDQLEALGARWHFDGIKYSLMPDWSRVDGTRSID